MDSSDLYAAAEDIEVVIHNKTIGVNPVPSAPPMWELLAGDPPSYEQVAEMFRGSR